MKLTKVVVKRSKWLRGNPVRSVLLNESGRMCCLGFACLAAGVPKTAIEEVEMPAGIDRELPPSLDKLIREDYGRGYDTPISTQLAATNDSFTLQPKEREAQIKALGVKAGIDFSFVD